MFASPTIVAGTPEETIIQAASYVWSRGTHTYYSEWVKSMGKIIKSAN